jgi:hypothetical protein
LPLPRGGRRTTNQSINQSIAQTCKQTQISIIGSVLVSLGVIIVLVPRWFGGCLGDETADKTVAADDAERTSIGGAGGHHEEAASSSGVSASGDSNKHDDDDENERLSQTETVSTVLNADFTLDARRSIADARSVEQLRKSVELHARRTKMSDGADEGKCQRKKGQRQSLPGPALV